MSTSPSAMAERLAFPSTIAKQRAADLLSKGFPVTGAGLAKEVGCSTQIAMNALFALARHGLCKQDDLKPGDHLVGTPFRQIQQPHAPSVESARAMRAKGSPAVEAERLAFEAWMHGHCWVVGGEWDGTSYHHPDEVGCYIDAQAMLTRQLWAAWRDRAALSIPKMGFPSVIPDDRNTDMADFDSPEHTGVGDWCAPGPATEQKRQWLLWYEDRDRGYQLYEDEAEARVAFARSETMGWNCHLFQHAPRSEREQAALEAEKADGEWIATTDKLHPDKPGLTRYEQIPCLIIKNREVMLRQWNCEHLVWDTEDGDDFYCKAEDVTHWMMLPGLPPK